MNEDDDLVLNAKAIGLAIGGAALAGMLFVLTRRDDKPTPTLEGAIAEPASETFADAAHQVVQEARSHREAVEGAAGDIAPSSRGDTAESERDLKAAAWDAQERARLAENASRAASSRVAADASQIASRVSEEAQHLAGKRDELADKAKAEARDVLGVKKKLAGKTFGPLPEGVAGEAAGAALQNLEKSLKAKAPLLLAARNRAQAMEIAQRELGPVLRDSALLALSTALGSAGRASQKAATAPQEVKERLSHAAPNGAPQALDDAAERLRSAHEAATAELLKARDEAEAEARAARAEAERLKAELAAKLEDMKQAADANGAQPSWSRPEAEPTVIEGPVDLLEDESSSDRQPATSDGKRGVPGLLWGGAGLGLAIFAMMDAERRESVLKMANDASVQLQELLRDLQGYDDEF